MGNPRPKPFDRRTSPQMHRTVIAPVAFSRWNEVVAIGFFDKHSFAPSALVDRPDVGGWYPLAMTTQAAEAACGVANDLWYAFLKSRHFLGRADA